jgi:hypothetical protein
MATVTTEFDVIYPEGIIRFYEFLPIFAYLQIRLDKASAFLLQRLCWGKQNIGVHGILIVVIKSLWILMYFEREYVNSQMENSDLKSVCWCLDQEMKLFSIPRS